jgi:HlyD family secretion protein
VQTAEGRATTVFAVKLAVDNAGGKLKPGMPADVYFDE